MKRTIITYLFLLSCLVASSGVYAQEMSTFKANDIKKLYLGGHLKVELIKSNEEKVEFKAPAEIKRLIKVKTSKGSITIKGKAKRLQRLSGRRVRVRVYYKQLEMIKARNGVLVSAKEPVKSKDLELIAIEGSIVDLQVQTKDLKARVSMGAEVVLDGTSDTFQVRVKMGSSLEAYGFKTNICYVKTGMGSDASVFAREAIYMSAGMGSSIKYRGNPKKVLKSSSWMGSDINRN